jgi:hypothetical protein
MTGRRYRQPLDPRKWFDRMQPQTLQIAMWLLYLNGFFAFLAYLDKSDWIGVARVSKGTLGLVVGLLVVVSYIGGGFLMANGRRIGYYFALFAAFSPFLLRLWILSPFDQYGLIDKLTGQDTFGVIFEIALCALLLHPHSREHQRVWYS